MRTPDALPEAKKMEYRQLKEEIARYFTKANLLECGELWDCEVIPLFNYNIWLWVGHSTWVLLKLLAPCAAGRSKGF